MDSIQALMRVGLPVAPDKRDPIMYINQPVIGGQPFEYFKGLMDAALAGVA